MDPISTATTVLGAGNQLVTVLRGAAESVKALGKIEIVGQLMDAQIQAMDLLRTNQQLFDEVTALKRHVAELNDKLKFQSALSFRAPLYFAENDPIPYCQKCWESERKAIHCKNYEDRSWDCPLCQTEYPMP